MNDKYSSIIVHKLLEVRAIKFNFQDPFTWTSGIKSPVYCDNRVSLSDHVLRSMIKEAYTSIIKDKFPDAEVIAGVATGAIAQGALVADQLNLPFIYVREKRKEYGLMKIIEGHFEKGQKVVILEDHISTGGSSLRACEELKIAEAHVLGMVAAFSYDFSTTKEKFNKNNCQLHVISTFSTIKNVAFEKGYISKEEAYQLDEWHNNVEI